MTVLLASFDYPLVVIPKYRTASYHGRKHFVFVRTMLALTLLGFVPTIRVQTISHVKSDSSLRILDFNQNERFPRYSSLART